MPILDPNGRKFDTTVSWAADGGNLGRLAGEAAAELVEAKVPRSR